MKETVFFAESRDVFLKEYEENARIVLIDNSGLDLPFAVKVAACATQDGVIMKTTHALHTRTPIGCFWVCRRQETAVVASSLLSLFALFLPLPAPPLAPLSRRPPATPSSLRTAD